MHRKNSRTLRFLFSTAVFGAVIGANSPSDAYVDHITVDSTSTATYTPVGSSATSYTIYSGRIFGALNPHDEHNEGITDIHLAPRKDGKVDYISNFEIVTPTDPKQRTGLMIYEVPNRGGSAISTSSLVPGATYVQSGWQGDLLTQCTAAPVPLYPCTDLSAGPYGTPRNGNVGPQGPSPLAAFVIQVPVATADGKPPNEKNTITGSVYGHILAGASGSTAQLVIFGSAWVPYQPAGYDPANPGSLSTSGAEFWKLESQTTDGVDGAKTIITDWTWANCPNGPPGTPNPYFICLGSGTFDPNKLYEMVLTAQNPLVLGVGFAATRDFISFLRNEPSDRRGYPNPISGTVRRVMSIGSSQSGSFIRGSIFYGFNEDEAGRRVVDGAWPQIDGRMMWMNERWAQETVIPNLYMGGDEAPVWWADFPDLSRGLPPNGILHRCARNNTCPQILETFGSNEFYDEKMGPDLTGFCVDCRVDIPLPPNVYRYYLPGTSHGGNISAASFRWSPPPTTTPVSDSATYPSNPNGENFTNNALQTDFIDLLMNGRPMPPSIPGITYPTLANRQLVPPNQGAVGFPDIPGFPFGGNMAWPPFTFNFGPLVDYAQQSGIPTIQPPIIERVLTEYVPRVNSDGNEDVGSVPSVLFQAPLGTYVGWNILPSGPYVGQLVQLSGGYWPFHDTKANRIAAKDPRPSLEERYGTHAGYVCVVTAAANREVRKGFLLVADAQTLIADASGSNVLAFPFAPTADDVQFGNTLCSTPDAKALNATGRQQ